MEWQVFLAYIPTLPAPAPLWWRQWWIVARERGGTPCWDAIGPDETPDSVPCTSNLKKYQARRNLPEMLETHLRAQSLTRRNSGSHILHWWALQRQISLWAGIPSGVFIHQDKAPHYLEVISKPMFCKKAVLKYGKTLLRDLAKTPMSWNRLLTRAFWGNKIGFYLGSAYQ